MARPASTADLSRRTGYAVSPVDGTPLFYTLTEPPGRSAGTVVLCDGIGCDGYVWKYLRRDLEPRWRVVHWHYRGHGRSQAPRSPGRVAIADLADDLVAVLDDCTIDRAVLAGHSMGVQVVLESYRRHRDRVQALVLMCGAPRNPLETFKGSDVLERVLPAVRRTVERMPRVASSLTRRLLPTRLSLLVAKRLEVNGLLLEEPDFMPYLEGLARIDPLLFLAMLEEAGRHSAVDLLPEITVPTLIVAGEHDGFTPPELSQRMADDIPGAELLMVEGGSHTAPIERPHHVDEVVVRFLDRVCAQCPP